MYVWRNAMRCDAIRFCTSFNMCDKGTTTSISFDHRCSKKSANKMKNALIYKMTILDSFAFFQLKRIFRFTKMSILHIAHGKSKFVTKESFKFLKCCEIHLELCYWTFLCEYFLFVKLIFPS